MSKIRVLDNVYDLITIIHAFFTFPLIHFTMVLFAISSKLIFNHFI